MKTLRITFNSHRNIIAVILFHCAALLTSVAWGDDSKPNPADLLHPKDGFGRAIVKTIQAASSGFESVKGKLTKSDADADTFECLIAMPGSVDTELSKTKPDGDSFVSFDFVEGSTDENSTQSTYDDLGNRLRELLVGWSVKDQPKHLSLWRGTRFEKGEFSVRLAWYKHKRDGTQSVVVTIHQPSSN